MSITEQNLKNDLIIESAKKFRSFLVNDLNIADERVSPVEELQQKTKDLGALSQALKFIGKEATIEYVSKLLIQHFELKEIADDNKVKLKQYVDLFVSFI